MVGEREGKLEPDPLRVDGIPTQALLQMANALLCSEHQELLQDSTKPTCNRMGKIEQTTATSHDSSQTTITRVVPRDEIGSTVPLRKL